ncbi:DgyrCDS5038 [Dimorphilus gyrociliatus]|uniref:DgyrCDS5038 n=1 Tax=Dimorphilus gyrociliatus TaxID=2664684 RepID=A0A7I8VIL4_9ANNE|nr:DgyrCDS5038 [Dimorphilus gyrociliatus]
MSLQNEMDDLAAANRKIYANFQKIRGERLENIRLSNKNFWDVVVMTTADENQKVAFETMVNSKVERHELPEGIRYLFYADPPGYKIGNGGSTIYTLWRMYNDFGRCEVDKWRILLLNAGGQSKRFPSNSVLGKLFLTLPCGSPSYSLIEIKMASYAPFLSRMPPGVFHGSADTIEVFDIGDESDTWTFNNPGFTALAHPSPISVGETHGVYILSGSPSGCKAELRSCRRVLQKPSIAQMREANAIVEMNDREPFCYSDSTFFFDHKIGRRLSALYDSLGGLKCEIDAYGDFLQALGTEGSDSHLLNAGNDPYVQKIRRTVYEEIKSSLLNVVVLNSSRFIHLGTMSEYREYLCHDINLRLQMNFSPYSSFSSGIVRDSSQQISNNGARIKGLFIHTVYMNGTDLGDGSIVDNCQFEIPMRIGNNCIISSCNLVEQNCDIPFIDIPSNLLIHTVAVSELPKFSKPKFVTIVFNVNDPMKKTGKDFQMLGQKLQYVLEAWNLQSFDENRLYGGNNCGPWYLQVFPAADTMSDSFLLALKMINAVTFKPDNPIDLSSYKKLYSMHTILEKKDVFEMISFRNNLGEILKKLPTS